MIRDLYHLILIVIGMIRNHGAMPYHGIQYTGGINDRYSCDGVFGTFGNMCYLCCMVK